MPVWKACLIVIRDSGRYCASLAYTFGRVWPVQKCPAKKDRVSSYILNRICISKIDGDRTFLKSTYIFQCAKIPKKVLNEILGFISCEHELMEVK